MQIFLLILRIIGIVLLSIAALLLSLIIIVLFWPIGYKIRFYKEDKLYLKAKATWLCHLITARFLYDDKPDFVVRVLGIPIYRRKFDETDVNKSKTVDNGSSQEDRNQKQELNQTGDFSKTDDSNQVEEGNQTEIINKTAQDSHQESHISGNLEIDSMSDSHDEDSQLTPEEQAIEDEVSKLKLPGKIKFFFRKVKELILKIIEICTNIEYTLQRFYARIKEIYALSQYYYKVWNRPKTKTSLLLCQTQILKILRHIRPRKLKSVFEFGTGDPASTAQYFGYYCMAKPWIGKQIIVNPHFEEKILVNHTYARGRVHVVVLLRVAWKLYFDKDLRHLIRLVKREGKKNGRR